MDAVGDLVEHAAEVKAVALHGELAGLDPVELRDRVDEVAERHGVGVDALEVLPGLRVGAVVEHQLGEALDHVQRRADLVVEPRQEGLGAHLALAKRVQLADQARLGLLPGLGGLHRAGHVLGEDQQLAVAEVALAHLKHPPLLGPGLREVHLLGGLAVIAGLGAAAAPAALLALHQGGPPPGRALPGRGDALDHVVGLEGQPLAVHHQNAHVAERSGEGRPIGAAGPAGHRGLLERAELKVPPEAVHQQVTLPARAVSDLQVDVHGQAAQRVVEGGAHGLPPAGGRQRGQLGHAAGGRIVEAEQLQRRVVQHEQAALPGRPQRADGEAGARVAAQQKEGRGSGADEQARGAPARRVWRQDAERDGPHAGADGGALAVSGPAQGHGRSGDHSGQRDDLIDPGPHPRELVDRRGEQGRGREHRRHQADQGEQPGVERGAAGRGHQGAEQGQGGGGDGGDRGDPVPRRALGVAQPPRAREAQHHRHDPALGRPRRLGGRRRRAHELCASGERGCAEGIYRARGRPGARGASKAQARSRCRRGSPWARASARARLLLPAGAPDGLWSHPSV